MILSDQNKIPSCHMHNTPMSLNQNALYLCPSCYYSSVHEIAIGQWGSIGVILGTGLGTAHKVKSIATVFKKLS
jgi:hypothetical protein